MTGFAAATSPDLQEQLARIERMNAETRQLVEEGLKLSAEARKLGRDATRRDDRSLRCHLRGFYGRRSRRGDRRDGREDPRAMMIEP